MARTVEERIVKLSVENGGFEGALAKSKASLTSFFSGLSRMGTADPMSKISAGAQNASSAMQGVGSATEGVTSRFNALSTMATGALLTIGSQAVQAGARLVKSMTIDPVMSGFTEYQEKMKAIGVVSANTGEDMGRINGVLGEMNTYADKTIYSFGDMTKNLGTFTAAGVQLDTAKTSIMGISNLAAAVGSNSQQAGMAMYQLSQAIASGKVGLQDWNSVVNAGMGGKKFQNALEENARAIGKGRDMTVSFRDSLQDGWLTTKVLTNTLTQFANDQSMLEMATQAHSFGDAMDAIKEAAQSGWSQMFESLIGGYEQSTKVWTGLQNFGSNVVSVIPGYFKKVGEAMQQAGADGLTPMNKIINAIKSIGDSLKIILAGPIKLIQGVIQKIAGGGMTFFTKLLPGALTLIAKGLSIVATGFTKVNDFATKFIQGVKTNFDNFFKTIKPYTDAMHKAFSDAFGKVKATTDSTLGRMSKAWDTFFGQLKRPLDAFNALFGRYLNAIVTTFTQKFGNMQAPIDDLKQAWGNLMKAFDNVGNAFVKLMMKLVPKDTGLGRFLQKLSDKATGFFDAIKPGRQDWIKTFTQKILDWSVSIEHASEKIEPFMHKTKEWIKSNELLQKSFEALKKIVEEAKNLFKIPTASANTVDGSPLDDLADSTTKAKNPIANAIDVIVGKFKELTQILKDPTIQAAVITFGVLAVALIGLSKVGKGLTAVTGAINSFRKSTQTLLGAIKEVPKSLAGMFSGIGTAFKTMATGMAAAGQIIAWAYAIKQVANALSTLADIPADKIKSGVIALSVSVGVIALAMFVLNKSLKGVGAKQLVGLGVSLLAFTTSITVLAGAMGYITSLNLGRVAMSLVMFTGAMVIITKTLSGAKLDPRAGLALIGIAAGLLAISASLAIVSRIPMGKLIGSLIALGGALAIIGFVGKGLSFGSAATLLAMAVAIGVMSVSLGMLSMIPLKAIGVGLLALGGAFVIFIAAVAVLGLIAPLVAAAGTAMLILSGAVLVLGAGLALGGLGIALFAASFVVAATAFVAGSAILIAGLVKLAPLVIDNAGKFTLMALALVPLVVVVGLLSVAMVLAGVAMLAAGVGMTLFAVGLGLLGVTAPIAAAGLVAFVTIVSTLSKSIGGFVDIAVQIGLGLAAIGLGAVVAGAGALVAAAGILALGLALAAAGLLALVFASSFAAAVQIMLDVMSYIPGVGGKFKEAAAGIRESGMADAAQEQSDKAVQNIEGTVPRIGAAGSQLGSSATTGLAGGLGGMFGTGQKGGADANGGLSSMLGQLGGTGTSLGTNADQGLASGMIGMGDTGSKGGSDALGGLSSFTGAMGGAGSGLGSNAQGALQSALGGMGGVGSKGGSDAVQGVRGQIGNANSAGNSLGSGAKSGAKSGSAGMHGLGSNAGSSFGSGIGSMVESVRQKAAALAHSAVETVKSILRIGSPSRVMKQIGKWTGEGMSIGMNNSASMVQTAAQKMASKTVTVMSAVADAANDALQGNLDFAPTITPVLDASSLQNASMGNIRLGGTVSDSLQQLATNNAPRPVTLDSTALDAKLAQLTDAAANQVILQIDKVYGTLDEATARRWAPQLAQSLLKVQKG